MQLLSSTFSFFICIAEFDALLAFSYNIAEFDDSFFINVRGIFLGILVTYIKKILKSLISFQDFS